MLYKGIMEAKKQRKRFPAEIRSDVVKMVLDGGKKCADVGKEFGVPTANVYAWVRQARIDAGHSGSNKSSTADRAELARLRRELKLREQEISFLKKTSIYFANLKKRDSGQ
jgi:transposase